jgi:hypothetical protein
MFFLHCPSLSLNFSMSHTILQFAFRNRKIIPLVAMSAATGGPSKKKQKVDHIAMNGDTVALSRLTKHTVGYKPELSPGALHSNRVAIQVRINTFNNFLFN